MIVYRESMVKAAGFDTFPKDTDGFLKLRRRCKDKGTPGGMALGNATGDSLWTQLADLGASAASWSTRTTRS